MSALRDAIVIGAGPAGCVAATRLAQAGWSVTLVERERFPRRKVCGECLAAANWPLLDALGVGDALRARAGAPLREVAVAWRDVALAAPLPPFAGLPSQRWGRAVSREVLDPLLLDHARAAGVQVLQPASVRALDGGPGDFGCEIDLREHDHRHAARDLQTTLRDNLHEDLPDDRAPAQHPGEAGDHTISRTPRYAAHSHDRAPVQRLRLRARVLIAAHGSWQPGPRAGETAARAAPRDDDLLAFKASFVGSALTPGRLWVIAFDGGYGGMVAGADGVATVACCVRRDRLRAARQLAGDLSAADAVREVLLAQCASVRDALRDARRVGPWLSAGPLRPGVHLPRGGGAVLRIGNAAGEAHPIIGEGMSMALQSAWLLADHLLAQGDPSRLDAARAARCASDYAADWHARFAPRIRLAAAAAHLAMRPALCATALPLLRRWPALLTATARAGGKVRCALPAH